MSYIAPSIGLSGLTIPTYQEILDKLIEEKQRIYGSDIYLGVDSTDYQELSVFALMLFDVLQTAQLVYNNRGPQSASGVALDSIVKVNGLSRRAATYSTVDLTITGVVGTIITNGVVKDDSGQQWNLPASVTIPIGGSVVVTATADESGEITATAGTVTTIFTPVSGWTSVTNVSAAVAGVAEETDAELRARQAISTAIPALSVLESIAGSLLDIDGVSLVEYYENKTNIADGNGVPAHSVAFMVEGGDANTIAKTINEKMTPGTGYFGTTTVTVYDDNGLPTDVKFTRPTHVVIDVEVSLTALLGYTSAIGDLTKPAIVEYINSLGIGQDVLWSRVLGASLLAGTEEGNTFNVTGLKMAVHGSSPYALAPSDISIAFDEMPESAEVNITLVVT